MWSLIKFTSNSADDIHYDVVPKKWIVNNKHCLYPDYRVSTIKKLAKENSDVADDWDILPIVIINPDISKYLYYFYFHN